MSSSVVLNEPENSNKRVTLDAESPSTVMAPGNAPQQNPPPPLAKSITFGFHEISYKYRRLGNKLDSKKAFFLHFLSPSLRQGEVGQKN